MNASLPPDGGTMDVASVRALRRRLVAQGFHFLPEITGRKFSAVEDYASKCGSFDPDTDYPSLTGPMLNTALYLSGLWGIDIDVDEVAVVEQILDCALDCLGAVRAARYRPHSSRMALLYQGATDGLYRAVNGSEGSIEIFNGSERKLSAFGWHTHKETRVRTRYQWQAVPGNLHAGDLTVIDAARATKFLKAVQKLLGEDVRLNLGHVSKPTDASRLLADDPDRLYAAAKFIPNQGEVHWVQWNKIGMALYAATGGSDTGLLAFMEYTYRNPKTRHRDCDKRWKAYAGTPPTRVGAGTIFKLARDNGFQWKAEPVNQFTALHARVNQPFNQFKRKDGHD